MELEAILGVPAAYKYTVNSDLTPATLARTQCWAESRLWYAHNSSKTMPKPMPHLANTRIPNLRARWLWIIRGESTFG